MKRVILILGVFGLLLASCQKADVHPNFEKVGMKTMVDADGNVITAGDQNESITDPNNDEDDDVNVTSGGITDPNNDEDEDIVKTGK